MTPTLGTPKTFTLYFQGNITVVKAVVEQDAWLSVKDSSSDISEGSTQTIGLDKNGYQVNIFLISQQKHMLLVLIRSASLRHF